MAKRLHSPAVKRAGAFAALALLAFAIYQFHIAIVIWEWISHYFPAWLAAAFAAIVVLGLIYMHRHELHELLKTVGSSAFVRHMIASRRLYIQTAAALIFGVALGVLLPSIKLPPSARVVVVAPQHDLPEVSAKPDEKPHQDVIPVMPPNELRPLPQFAEVLPKARNDYCVLGAAFNAEACRAFIEQNPNLGAQGGRRLGKNERYVFRPVGPIWVIEIIRLPPKRTGQPLDLRAR